MHLLDFHSAHENVISLHLKWPSFLPLGANVIKLFNVVIYCCSTVIPSFCVINWYYYGYYCGMLVSNTMVLLPWYFNPRKSRHCSKLPWYFYNTGQKYHSIWTLEKGGTTVNYCGIFITFPQLMLNPRQMICCMKCLGSCL